MKYIVSSDSYTFKYSPEEIYNAVSDVSVYGDWWSENVKIKVLHHSKERIGSKIEIRASGGWFRCEIISLIPGKEVKIKYYEGVQIGEGIWKFEKTGETETTLTYTINLEPYGFIPRFLSNFINFSKIHSKSMNGMFKSLDKYLSEDFNKRKQNNLFT